MYECRQSEPVLGLFVYLFPSQDVTLVLGVLTVQILVTANVF